LPPLTAIERRAFDYTPLEEAMAHLNAVVRNARQAIRAAAAGEPPAETLPADLADPAAMVGA
jgi:hypothetical protein